jgi:hypothetical protein
MPPVSLSDYQLGLIREAARSVPIEQRSAFLQNVAKHLGHRPSDAAVQAAVDAQLSVGRLPVILCDHARKE